VAEGGDLSAAAFCWTHCQNLSANGIEEKSK
jgi:hypothetical protein